MQSTDLTHLKRRADGGSNPGYLLRDPATGRLVRGVEVVVAASSHTDTTGYGGTRGKKYTTKTVYPDGESAYVFPVECDERTGTYMSDAAFQAACLEEYMAHPSRYNSVALHAALSGAPSGWPSGSAQATAAPTFAVRSGTNYVDEEYQENGETKTRRTGYRYKLARLGIRFDVGIWCVQPRSSLCKQEYGWYDDGAARYIAIAGYTSMDISLPVGFSIHSGDGGGARAVVTLAGTGDSMPSSFAGTVADMDGGTQEYVSFPLSSGSSTVSFTDLPVATYAWGYLFVEDLASRSIYNTVSIGTATVTYRR